MRSPQPANATIANEGAHAGAPQQAPEITENPVPRTNVILSEAKDLHPAPLIAIMPTPISTPSELLSIEKIELVFPEEISRREKLQAIADNLVLDPLRASIYNVARIFYERKNDVEMYVEQSEFAQKTIEYFAQR
jgi:hypothetical protein